MNVELSTNAPLTNFSPIHNPFKSFWMGGFECTDQLNAFGNRVDFLKLTGHLQMLDQDYQNLKPFAISTVREGIRWSQVENKPYQYDWRTVAHMLERGKINGIQQVWDLCHFGYPDDLTPLHPLFARRFAALCRAFVQFYRSVNPDESLIVTPINEVSFMAWLGGEVRGTAPYCVRQGGEVKYGLMQAYIEGIAAMREIDPGVRILTTEPLIQIVPRYNATVAELEQTRIENNSQFESVDMLCGRLCPELGGKPEYLDILGYNFYYNNRYETGFTNQLCWRNSQQDPRWGSLADILADAYDRYGKPMAITETSHPGIDRPDWIRYIGEECVAALQKGLPLWGACLYPIIDRPCWDHLHPWHRSGLWDAEEQPGEIPQRLLYKPYAEALLEAQERVSLALMPETVY